jgi:hypothetical protein
VYADIAGANAAHAVVGLRCCIHAKPKPTYKLIN